MYVKLGEHNGGVILNVSEGGLAVQAAVALTVDNLPPVRFQLSANKWVQTSARIAWLTQSKRTAGLEFDNLAETARADIRGWLALEKTSFPPKAPRDEENLSKIDATPENAIAQAKDSASLENQQHSIPSWQPEAPRPSLKATVSGTELSSFRSRDERTDKRVPHELIPPQMRPHGAEDGAHVLRGQAIAARLRRYLVDERHRIRLYDLVSKETEGLCAQLTEADFPTRVPISVQEFLTRIHRYEELSEVLLLVIALGCFWGDRNMEPIWPRMIERVATVSPTNTGEPQWTSLCLYPALLLLYTGGLALVARGNYSALAALLLEPKLKGEDGNCSLIEVLYPSFVISDERFRTALCGATQYRLPTSAYLYALLRERLREFIPADTEYSAVFDRFEYILALVWTDQNPKSTRVDWIPVGGPAGLFASRALGRGETSVIDQMNEELSDLGKNCPVLRSGLFGGSTGRLRSASQRITARIQLEKNHLAQAGRIRGAG